MRQHRHRTSRIWWTASAFVGALAAGAVTVVMFRPAASDIAAGPIGLTTPISTHPNADTAPATPPRSGDVSGASSTTAPVGRASSPGASRAASTGVTLTPQAAVDRAAAYGAAHGERVGIAVYDRSTGAYYGAGEDTAQFRSGSVFKVFIAIELLHSGQMNDPDTERLAHKMITQSDDAAANELYFQVGGPDVVYRVEDLYGISGMDRTPDTQYWGKTRITPQAMAELYQHLAVDPVAGPWLMDAMAHATELGSDGVDQFFGIPSVAGDWRVKQGWMNRDGRASINTTGYIGHDRYIVVILSQGPAAGYLTDDTRVITAMTKLLLPGGQFPSG
jgi:hypothetical protein